MLEEIGIMGILIFILLVILIPFIATIILGIAIANMIGFTGWVWWSFLIVFYLFVSAVLSRLNK